MHPLINDSKYTFDKFLTESREGLGTTKHVLIIYAKTQLKKFMFEIVNLIFLVKNTVRYSDYDSILNYLIL